jgi:hypothetical protein
MSFMLSLLVLVVLLVCAVAHDLRRRHAPSHDIESAARNTRADADARRAGGGYSVPLNPYGNDRTFLSSGTTLQACSGSYL